MNVPEDIPELESFYLATKSLREAMERDVPLHDFDRLCLENYIALLQLSYIEWKRRNTPPPAYKRAA